MGNGSGATITCSNTKIKSIIIAKGVREEAYRMYTYLVWLCTYACTKHVCMYISALPPSRCMFQSFLKNYERM